MRNVQYKRLMSVSFFYSALFIIVLLTSLIHIYVTYRNASAMAAGHFRPSAGILSFIVTDPEALEELQSELLERNRLFVDGTLKKSKGDYRQGSVQLS